MIAQANAAATLDSIVPDEPSDAFSLAQRAIELTRQHNTPPVPNTFAIWYAYASRSNEKVVDAVDGLISKSGALSEYEINEIYESYLAKPTSAEKQESLQDDFDRELADILNIVKKSSSSTEVFAQELAKFETLGTRVSMPNELKAVLATMIHESARFNSVTRELSDSLKQSQDHIEQLKRSLEEIKNEAQIDALTKVMNRRGFDTKLQREFEEAEASGAPFCLAICDIDHFKKINDTYGHSVGDVVLKAFASILKQNIKGRDTVARYGGEEFAIILPGTDLIQAHNLMVSIKKRIEKTHIVVSRTKERVNNLTASFGVSKYEPGLSIAEIIERSDRKLYEAKRAGRNAVRTYGIG